jgi:hypothetical protein
LLNPKLGQLVQEYVAEVAIEHRHNFTVTPV